MIRYAIKQYREAGPDERWKKIMVLPNYQMPSMESYSSEDGRILLMGDAAHGIKTRTLMVSYMTFTYIDV